MRIVSALIFGLFATLAMAAPADPLRRGLEDWLTQELANAAGPARFLIGNIDPRINAAACTDIQFGLPAGYRLIGRTTVRAQCLNGANWVASIPVQISIKITYYTAARALSGNREIREGDITAQEGDLAQLPGSVILDPAQALGRILNTSLPAGAPLRQEMLRAPIVITQHQKVKVLYRDGGIEVANEGTALAAAAEGQPIRVKVGNGQTITGIARMGGIVEIGQ